MVGNRALAQVMNYLYSLYDALVSISVPADKARAIVDAMERDMGTTLATKQDLVLLRQEVRQDLQLFRQEMASMRTELKQEIENRCMLLAHEISTLSLKMTVRLGSMLFVGFGLMIAALRVWT